MRFASPSAIRIADYSPPEPRLTRAVPDGGAGFDAVEHEGLCSGVRRAIAQAVAGREAAVDMRALGASLSQRGYSAQWRTGGVHAWGAAMHGLVASGRVVVPANGVVLGFQG